MYILFSTSLVAILLQCMLFQLLHKKGALPHDFPATQTEICLCATHVFHAYVRNRIHVQDPPHKPTHTTYTHAQKQALTMNWEWLAGTHSTCTYRGIQKSEQSYCKR